MSILVIDDEKGLRDMLCYALRRRRYKVRAEDSAEAGIAAARTEDFDVIICDVMMPGMNGIQALAILKSEHPATEVILVTGYPDTETAAQVMAQGAFDYLAKPYELAALCALLEKAVANKRAGALRTGTEL